MQSRKLLLMLVLIALSTASFRPGLAHSPLPRVDLTLWHIEPELSDIQTIFDRWAAENAPGSTLTLVHYQIDDLAYAIDSGQTPPDLMWTVADQIPDFVAGNHLQPVDSLVDKNLFLASLVGMAQVEGHLYGVPMQGGNMVLLYYNKHFAPDPPSNLDDFRAHLAALAQNAPKDFYPLVYDQRDPFWIIPLAHALGATQFGADGKTLALDSPAWVKTYQYLYDLKFKDKAEPDDCFGPCSDRLFTQGQAAFTIATEAALRTNRYASLGDDLGVAVIPADVAPASSYITGRYLLFSAGLSGDKRAVAEAFAQYLALDIPSTLARTWPHYRMPALLAALDDPQITQNDRLNILRNAMKDAQPLIMGRQQDCIFNSLKDALRSLINDITKPEEAAKAAQQNASDCLAQP
jgi:ABC-type glycerol-3-phosphate transport system substrate-binding protein